jgi:amidohydrolase
VRFAFQPAEERIGGAKRMIDQGVMDDPKVEQVFGFHLWASTPLGHVLISPGPIFAAATHIRIIIRGRGGHAAAPHQTIDPIVVASHVVIALQTIVSRAVDPADTAVVTIGRIEGGVRGTIIPNEVMLTGTIRTFEPKVLGVTQAWRAEYQFDHSTLPAVVNDAAAAELAHRVAADLVGPDRIGAARATGADDMSYFLERAPGAYVLLGAAPRNAEHVHPHHHPGFDFDEGALSLGTEFALRIIEAATASTLS